MGLGRKAGALISSVGRLECLVRDSPHAEAVTAVVPIRPGMVVTAAADKV